MESKSRCLRLWAEISASISGTGKFFQVVFVTYMQTSKVLMANLAQKF